MAAGITLTASSRGKQVRSDLARQLAKLARVMLVATATWSMMLNTAPAFAEERPMTMVITSSTHPAGGAMPAIYTCEGRDISPPLSWTGVPAAAKSLVLIVDDPDAPDPAAPKMTWVHWIVFNLPPASTGLPEAVKSSALLPGAEMGLNDWGRASYGGPCPPVGRHRYFHKLYALDTILPKLPHADKPAVEAAMQGHFLARATLIGTYEKHR
jgi:Raf kinase inhibitor-like YbhB/YbcL family protein